MRQVLLAVLFASACGQEKNGTKSSFSRRDMLKFGASTAVLSAAGLAVGSYLENIDQWLSEPESGYTPRNDECGRLALCP